MKSSFSTLCVLLVVICFCQFTFVLPAAGVSLAHLLRRAPILPDQDPFYAYQDSYASEPLGKVLKSRKVDDISLFGTLPLGVDAWQLLFRSEDALGNPAASVTTILQAKNWLPNHKGPNKFKYLVSYQTAEDSLGTQCAPSYQFRDVPPTHAFQQYEILFIEAFLGKGYTVNVPDYEGSRAGYAAGPMEGKNVLNSIRAALSFNDPGLLPYSTNVGIFGYSGAAIASGWAAQLQPFYAPEMASYMKIAVLGGTPASPRYIIEHLTKTKSSGVGLAALGGVIKSYPAVQKLVDSLLTAKGNRIFAKINDQCLTNIIDENTFLDINSLFDTKRVLKYNNYSSSNWLEVDEIKKTLKEITMGKDAPTVPLFMYHSAIDEIVFTPPTDQLVQDWCSKGSKISYQRDLTNKHADLFLTGMGVAIKNMDSYLVDGAKPVSECKTTNTVTSLADPIALGEYGSVILGNLKGLMGGLVKEIF